MGVALWGGWVYFLGRRQFVLCPFSHFEMQDFKNSKLFACSTPIFNIHIFRFKIDALLEIDADFTMNPNFLDQGAVSFHPLVGTQNQPNLRNCFFIYLMSLEGPPNHPVCKACLSVLYKCKQTWQLIVKTESDLFVNKQTVYNTKSSFVKESTDSLSLTDKPSY